MSARNLSCKRCRFRKIKCSRTEPCEGCISAGQNCVYREQDSKRKTFSLEYVEALERRISSLESSLAQAKTLNITLEAQYGDQTDQTRTIFQPEALCSKHETGISQDYDGLSQNRGGHTSLSDFADGYEATGISRVCAFVTFRDPSRSLDGSGQPAAGERFAYVASHFGIDVEGKEVQESLRTFFKWQYPQYMFIYREAFLREYHNQGIRSEGRCCSLPLLLAICSLGASSKADKDLSQRFSDAAESILVVSGISQSSLTAVQAFLCLAFTAIGRGDLTKGWMLSGTAFRMAQHLGFQRDPQVWQLETPSDREDIEILRRIYWGCFISDKIISLMLGRPISLYDKDAAVEPMERLPDFPEMTEWLPEGEAHISRKAGFSAPTSLEIFKQYVKLAKIIQRIMLQVFSPASSDINSRLSSVECLGLDLQRWQASLPNELQFNRWQAADVSLLPSVAGLHILFQSVRGILSMNVACWPTSPAQQAVAREDCLSAAMQTASLLRRFRYQHGLTNTSLSAVYALVLAHTNSRLFGTAEEAHVLAQYLDELSHIWRLATAVKKWLHLGNN